MCYLDSVSCSWRLDENKLPQYVVAPISFGVRWFLPQKRFRSFGAEISDVNIFYEQTCWHQRNFPHFLKWEQSRSRVPHFFSYFQLLHSDFFYNAHYEAVGSMCWGGDMFFIFLYSTERHGLTRVKQRWWAQLPRFTGTMGECIQVHPSYSRIQAWLVGVTAFMHL